MSTCKKWENSDSYTIRRTLHNSCSKIVFTATGAYHRNKQYIFDIFPLPPYILQKRLMRVNLPLESILYTDENAAIPGGFCPLCGSELYPPGYHCIRCEKENP